jgi:hypothetical protein
MSYRQYLNGDILSKLDNEYIIISNNEEPCLNSKYAIYMNGQCGFNYKIEKILENGLIQVSQELRTNRKFNQRSIINRNSCILFCKKNKNRILYYFKKKI